MIREIGEDKVFIPFDIKAIFPSVPIQEAPAQVEDYLHQQREGTQWESKVKQHMKLVKPLWRKTTLLLG